MKVCCIFNKSFSKNRCCENITALHTIWHCNKCMMMDCTNVDNRARFQTVSHCWHSWCCSTLHTRKMLLSNFFHSVECTSYRSVHQQDSLPKTLTGGTQSDKSAFECQWKNNKYLNGSKVGKDGGWLGWHRETRIHKSHHDLSIYFSTCFHSAGGSSVPSGGALGSRKSGCCSSFRYLVGVRMWVPPTEDKSLKAELWLNPGALNESL